MPSRETAFATHQAFRVRGNALAVRGLSWQNRGSMIFSSSLVQRACGARSWSIKTSLMLAFVTLLVDSTSASAAGKEPPVVTPGATFSHGAPPPADAVVLFDGKDLSKWEGPDGKPAGWKVENGYVEVAAGAGGITTREQFGDIQLHLEWASPAVVSGKDQGRGNSGVYFQGRYEIQVLDSYENPTYPDGQAGAFYGHAAPQVNAARKPGEWQSYDIIFHAPKKGADGKVVPGSFTVIHNGVVVQDHVPIPGGSTTAAPASGVVEKGPIHLQDHGNPVRYRNIWLRRLPAAGS